jgi:hypothetical protein
MKNIREFKCKLEEKNTCFIWHYTVSAHNEDEAEIRAKIIVSMVARCETKDLKLISIKEKK